MDQQSLICRICGDKARGYNFGVISCMACKAFFRRNALRLPGSILCNKNSDCAINKDNRSLCSACRLQKCFLFGMKRDLIQSHAQNEEIIEWRNNLPLPQPIGLLRQDRSLMTVDEWTLLSNLTHLYDRMNICERISTSIIQEQASLPLRLRAKSTSLINIFFESNYCVENLIRSSNDFKSLPIVARRRLLKNNFLYTDGLNIVIIDKCLEVSANKDFDMAFMNFAGPDGREQIMWIREKMDENLLLAKMFLFIILFSSNFSIIRYDPDDDLQSMSHSIEFVRYQDKYVTMLWKYMIYQFGHTEAVLRYSSMMRTVMGLFNVIEFLSERSIIRLLMGFIELKFNELALVN